MPYNEATLERLQGWGTAAMEFGPLLAGQPMERPLAEVREDYNRELARSLPPEGVSFQAVDLGGIPGEVAIPQNAVGNRAMLYIHGGGYVSGGPSGYHGIGGNFANMLGARVYMPDYRLAPDHPFPAPLDDCLQAYLWLLGEVADARDIVLAGDSAGGAMVISLMVRARNAGLDLPAAGVAISPWVDLQMTSESYVTRDGIDPLCTRDFLISMARIALGDTRPNDPEASPVFADVRGISPMMIQIGEREVMLSDSFRMAQHLTNSQVRVALEVWPEMFHVWPMFSEELPEAMQALRSACDFLNRHLDNESAACRPHDR